MFEAFNEIYQNNKNVKLLLIGPIEISQISDKNLIKKISQHPGIINYGKVKQEDVPGAMMAIDVFVLPAWWEGFGNVLVQAAAMGVPVISTNGTGTIDAVSDGFNGILVPVADINALKNAMLKLYSDKALRNEFAINGLEWVKNFDRNMIWNEMDKIYNTP